MSKELAYFKDFLENPVSFKVGKFYPLLNEWAIYLTEHKDEFNYLEDEEWREIRERLFAAVKVKEELRQEFEALEFRLRMIQDFTLDRDKITVYREWLEFLKKNQTEYDFHDDEIAKMENNLAQIISSIDECAMAEEKLKESKAGYKQALDTLDDSAFENYERTGKRPVISTIKPKKDYKGN